MIAGINKAYILPYYGAEKANGSITVKEGYKWERIPIQRDSAAYEVGTTLGKSGKLTKHTATMDVLTLRAQEVHRYREKCRTRHLLALVLNTGETVIAGVDAPMRMKMEPGTAENPEGIVGFSLKFECVGRSGKELYSGKLTVDIVSGFGKLYNGYAANQELINGWRIPTLPDLHEIASAIGYPFDSGLESQGGGLLKETTEMYWDSPNTGATNQFGLSIIGSGVRENNFFGKKEICKIWCAENLTLFFYKDYSSMTVYGDEAMRGASIRLVKSVSEVVKIPKFITDFDGNSYPVIRIGNVLITTSDYRATRYANGNLIPNITDNTEWAAITTGAYCTYNNE